jgi:ATP-binding cassette, subfamily G (WHITE), eye pigment precursor transporter
MEDSQKTLDEQLISNDEEPIFSNTLGFENGSQ